MTTRITAALASVMLLLLAGSAMCGVDDAKRRRGLPAPPAMANVLLITVDSLRADRLGCYTEGRERTPAIDALAGRSVRFARAYTASPSTAPSNASVITGLNPARHGLRHDLGGRLAEEVPTLAQILSRAGYRTGAIVGSFHLDSDRGVNRGFEIFDDDIEGVRKLVGGLSMERRADEVVRRGLQFLDGNPKGKPFFLWLNFRDPRFDYDPPPELAEEFENDPYMGEVAHVDAQLGVLMDALRKRDLYAGTHIIFAGSHGEGLGDNGEFSHGIYLFETTIRVPLLIKVAGTDDEEVEEVAAAPVALIDIAPTILELAGLDEKSDFDGRSLTPLLLRGDGGEDEGRLNDRKIFVEAVQPRQAYGWSPLYAVIDGDRKVVRGGYAQAFDLRADPTEEKPLAPAPKWVGELEAYGRPLLGELEPPKERREQIMKEAIALKLPWDNSPICLEKHLWPDPRDADRVALNEDLFMARTHLENGFFGWANQSARKALETDPANFTALEVVVFVAIQLRWRDIVLEPLELLQCNYPYRASPYHLLGHYYVLKEKPEEAEAAFLMLARLDPHAEEAEFDLAKVYAEMGKKDLAFEHLERAIALGATDFELLRLSPRLAPLRDDPRFEALLGGGSDSTSEPH